MTESEHENHTEEGRRLAMPSAGRPWGLPLAVAGVLLAIGALVLTIATGSAAGRSRAIAGPTPVGAAPTPATASASASVTAAEPDAARSAVRSTRPGTGQLPPVYRSGDRTYQFAGTTPWRSAVVDQRDPRVLHLNAGADSGSITNCTALTVAFLTAESATGVTVTTANYQPEPGARESCIDVGYRPYELTVTLSTPLAGRALTDGSGGGRHAALDLDTIPMPSYLPTGYRQSALGWDDVSGAVSRTYADGDTQLIVDLGHQPFGSGDQEQVLATATVSGRPAKVVQDRGFDDNHRIAWQFDDDQWIRLQSVDPNNHPLDPDTLIRIARSVRIDAAPAGPRRPAAVPATLLGGYLVYAGVQSFTDPAVDPQRPDTVMVTAGERWATAGCGPISQAFVLSESDTSVEIVVAQYQPAVPVVTPCPAMAETNVVAAQLARPLGNRSVIDATGNWLLPSELPRQFRTPSRLQARVAVTARTFAVSGQTLSVESGPGSVESRIRAMVADTSATSQARRGASTIHEQPATLVEQSRYAVVVSRCLLWQEAPGTYLMVCAGGATVATVAVLSEVAQSLPSLG